MNVISQPGTTYVTHELSWFQLVDKHSTFEFVRLLDSQPDHMLESLIHLKNSNGLTLLHKACMKSDALLVAKLLRLGSSYDIRTANGLLAIHLAASKGQPLILELLRRAGAQLTEPDLQGRLIIHYAAEFNQVSVLAYLHQCTNSFDPNTVDSNGLAALHLACSTGSKQAVQYLLNSLDKPKFVSNRTNSILVKDFSGNTCLHSLVCKSSGSSTHSSGRNRASEILWTLFTSLPNYPAHESPLLLIKSLNKSNQSALDIARQAQLPKPVLGLLSITFWLVSNFDIPRARSLLIFLYSIVWFVSSVTPLIVFALFALVAIQIDSNWPYIIATILILLYATQQRYRLDDATNRPNPFFAGSVFSGFIISLFCYLNYLLRFNLSIAPTLPVLILIAFAIVAPAWLFIFARLLFMDPGKVRQSPTASLRDLIQTQLERISHLLDCKPSTNPKQPFPLLTTPFVDLYCPLCNIVNPSQENYVKHCKLCDACFENMDHHCLFISRCVAQSNHRYFIIFLILTVLFTSLFTGTCMLTFLTHLFSLELEEPLSNLYSIQSVFSHFPLPFILSLFNLFSWFWAITLLLDQLNSISLNQPTRFSLGRPRKPYSRWAWLKRWKTVIGFIVFDKRLKTNQTDIHL